MAAAAGAGSAGPAAGGFRDACNLRCPMCPVWGLEDETQIAPLKGIMNVSAAREMLDEFTTKKPMVAPSIYGEPLLIPNLRQVLKDVKSRAMPLALNTNGLTLTESIAQFFCDIGVDSVMFSIVFSALAAIVSWPAKSSFGLVVYAPAIVFSIRVLRNSPKLADNQ
jgi:sulfatase maturation enzyme AslB (radical SAM superfamily)